MRVGELTTIIFTERRVEMTPAGKLFSNPNVQQFLNLLKKNLARHRQSRLNRDEAFVRGFADYKNNVFWIWDGNEATHEQMGNYISRAYDVDYGYDKQERPIGLLPLIIGNDPTQENTVVMSAPDAERTWGHPGARTMLRGLKLKRDRFGDYELKYEDIP